jgi:hypothetical protein
MDLREAIARHVLRDLTSDELPSIAVDALLAGHQSVSLAALAGATRADSPGDLWELFGRSLVELGIATPPTRVEAAEYLKRLCARQVTTGQRAPMDGAREIVGLMHAVELELPKMGSYVGENFGVAQLVGLYYSWDDVPFDDDASHARIEQSLRQTCARIAKDEPDPV